MKNFYTKFIDYLNESQQNIYIKDIDNEYIDELFDMMSDDFYSYSSPIIGLFDNDKIIGGVLIDEDYLPWEYRFDVVIDKGYRGKGYLKLLINRLIEKFNADEKADQLSAIVVNKKLTDILVNKFGFSKGEFEGDDFVWIRK